MSKNVKFVLQVVLSVLTFGITWSVSNQAAIVTALAIVIVWVLKYVAQTKGVTLTKEVVTGGLYVISFLLVIAFNPGILPTWPVNAEVSEFIQWARQATILLLPYTGAAMTIYNVLLKSILDEMPGMFGALIDTEHIE